MKKGLSEALTRLQSQLDEMSIACEKWVGDIEEFDPNMLLELEKEFLCCKKKVFNAANGVSREFIRISHESPIKV